MGEGAIVEERVVEQEAAVAKLVVGEKVKAANMVVEGKAKVPRVTVIVSKFGVQTRVEEYPQHPTQKSEIQGIGLLGFLRVHENLEVRSTITVVCWFQKEYPGYFQSPQPCRRSKEVTTLEARRPFDRLRWKGPTNTRSLVSLAKIQMK